MRITSTGNVNIKGTNTKLSWERTSDGASDVVFLTKTDDLGSNGTAKLQGYDGITFHTSGPETERMRITSNGNVTIKAPNASGGGVLNLENTTNAVNGSDWGSLNFISNDSSTSASGIRASVVGTSTSFNGDGNLVFNTAPSNGTVTERMRITSGGNVEFKNGTLKVGDSTTAELLIIPSSDGFAPALLQFHKTDTASQTVLQFLQNNSQKGSIT